MMEDSEIERIMRRYSNDELPYVPAVSSTASPAANMIATVSPPGMSPNVTIQAHDPDTITTQLQDLEGKGYRFSADHVKIVDNAHQQYLACARGVLLTEVLQQQRQRPDAIRQVINNCGNALNLQIDVGLTTSDSQQGGISQKLRKIGLANDLPDLYQKYCDLNSFYNATKHAGKPKNRTDQERLLGPDRRAIAIDFFETVRRIFVWYYEKTTGQTPAWSELAPVDYEKHGADYDIERRWHADKRQSP